MKIPETLSFRADGGITWLHIEGPVELIGKITAFMIQNQLFPATAGGSAAPFYISMPFLDDDAKRLVEKLKEMGGEEEK